MRVVLTMPGFSVHGGLRVIMEWANRLAIDNRVTILTTTRSTTRPDWFPLSERVQITNKPTILKVTDVLVICSPHSIELEDHPYCPKRVFIFLQMMEHLFRPHDVKWRELCNKFYLTSHPMILGANWNAITVRNMGRTGPIHYVPNGVNFDHFPIERKKEYRKTILLESPDSPNAAKDIDRLALKVAERLANKGFQVLAYGANPLGKFPFIDQWYVKPNLETMNMLYRKADVLVKATLYDARALAPMEGMTKECVTARAIVAGDDDLTDGVNCIKVDYREDLLYSAALLILEDEDTRNKLKDGCWRYIHGCGWEGIIDNVKTILNS